MLEGILWAFHGRGHGTKKGQNKKREEVGKWTKFKKKQKRAYLESLQTTACCGGALPTLVTLHAAVQTTAVVRLIQTLRLLKNNSCITWGPAEVHWAVGNQNLPAPQAVWVIPAPPLIPVSRPQSDPLGPDLRSTSKMTASCPSASPPRRERPEWVKKKRKLILTSYPRNFFQSWDSEIHLALVTKWTLPHWWGLINRLAWNGI